MNFVDRVGAALVEPRRALAAVDAGRGGMPDALLLVLLKVVCTETPLLVASLWSLVVLGAGVTLSALLARLAGVIGTDLLLLTVGGVAIFAFAGPRRDAARDFDLGAVASIARPRRRHARDPGGAGRRPRARRRGSHRPPRRRARVDGVGLRPRRRAARGRTVTTSGAAARAATRSWSSCRVAASRRAPRSRGARSVVDDPTRRPRPLRRARRAPRLNAVTVAEHGSELRPRGAGDAAPDVALRPLESGGAEGARRAPRPRRARRFLGPPRRWAAAPRACSPTRT